MGTAGGSGSGPRTWDTLAQPAETHPRTHNLASTQLTSRKKANFGLLAGLDWLTGLAGLAAAPGTVRSASGVAAGRHHRTRELIAQ